MGIFHIVVDLFTCFGIVIAVLEFHLARKVALSNNEKQQKQSTVEFYMGIKDELYELNHQIYSKYKNEKIIYSDVKNDEKMMQDIKRYLNIMEIVATGVNTGVYNINVFDRLYGDARVRYADQLSDYIEHRRTILGYPEMYADYQLLVNKLKDIHNQTRLILNTEAELKNTLETRKK